MRFKSKIKLMVAKTFICVIFLLPAIIYSQNPATLKELLQLAETNYPLIKSKMYDVQAAQSGITASKSTFIPTLDASYQLNYATYNNITGMAFPSFLVPISGPPSSGNTFDGVFGSVASLLFNWQPLTFGQRKAQVDYSTGILQYANADMDNEIFQLKVKVINTYLDLLTATELLKVYQQNISRTQSNYELLLPLVVNGIRPGVDTALLKADISRARIDYLNAQNKTNQIRIYLSQLLATDTTFVFSDTSYFLKLPQINSTQDTIKHPLIDLFTSNLNLSIGRKKIISRSALPTLNVWGTFYARGSGIGYNGILNTTDGLGFQRFNYGVGLQLNIPILQFARIKPLVKQQNFLVQSSQEKLNEVNLQLKAQQELADSNLYNAVAIIKESPVFLESAQFSYKAILSRYQTGLANYSDLVQAQYNLLKAETDIKIAYITVWKAFLFKAAVNGDLTIFTNQVN